MTKTEWISRCAARLDSLERFSAAISSHDVAAELAAEQAEKYGASGVAWEEPEVVAERYIEEE